MNLLGHILVIHVVADLLSKWILPLQRSSFHLLSLPSFFRCSVSTFMIALLYRFRRLSDKGWNKLHQERKRKDSDNVTLEEYSELCNMYLGINESEDCIATRE